MLNWIFKFLLGDDIFISYSRADGATYAAGLANELTKLRFSCKLDQWGTESGAEMPESLKKSLKRSAVLVLVGTEGAAKSRHVGSEIEEFKRTGRVIVPVIFDGTLLKNGLTCKDGELVRLQENSISSPAAVEAIWAGEIEGLPISADKPESLKTGDAADEIVSRIEKTFTFSRKDERLRKTSLATAILLLLLIAASAVAFGTAVVKGEEAAKKTAEAVTATAAAEEAKKNAEDQQKLADAAKKDADEQKRIAGEEKAKAVGEKEKADKASKLATEKTKLAAEKTKLAAAAQKEAEKQTEIAEQKRKEAEEQAERTRQLTYAANIQLADNLYDSGQQEAFEEILNGIDGTLGNFELNYLKHLSEGLVNFPGLEKEENVSQLTFSPDGKYLVGSGKRSPVILWNSETGQPIDLKVAPGLSGDDVRGFAFSKNGERLAAVFPKNIFIWDTATWEPIEFAPGLKPGLPEEEYFTFVSFAASADELFTASGDKEVYLRRWNIPGQSQVGDVKDLKLKTKPYELTILKIMPDGKTFVSYVETEEYPSIRVVLLDAMSPEVEIYYDPEGEPNSFLYNPYISQTGNRIAVVRELQIFKQKHPEVFVFDVGAKEVKLHLEPLNDKGEEQSILSLAFSPDEKRLAVVYHSEIRIWNIEKKETERIIPIKLQSVNSVVFSPDGSRLATADDNAVRMWDTRSESDVFTFRNEKSVGYSSDGKKIITSNTAGQWTLWNTLEQRPIKDLGKYDEEELTGVLFSPAGNYFLTQRKEGSEYVLQLHDAAGEELKLVSKTGCRTLDRYVGINVFSENGRRLAVPCADGTIRIWNLEERNGAAVENERTVRLQNVLPKNPESGEYSRFRIQFTGNGEGLFITINVGRPLEKTFLWDIETDRKIPEVCPGEIVNMSPDGKWIITSDKKFIFFRLRNENNNKSCKEQRLLSVKGVANFVFSLDSSTLGVFYKNNTVSILKLKETPIKNTIYTIESEVNRFTRLSRSGRWLSAGNNKYLDTITGKEIKIAGCVEYSRFSIDEERLLANCGSTGILKIWSLESGLELLNMKIPDSGSGILIDKRHLLVVDADGARLWKTAFNSN